MPKKSSATTHHCPLQGRGKGNCKRAYVGRFPYCSAHQLYCTSHQISHLIDEGCYQCNRESREAEAAAIAEAAIEAENEARALAAEAGEAVRKQAAAGAVAALYQPGGIPDWCNCEDCQCISGSADTCQCGKGYCDCTGCPNGNTVEESNAGTSPLDVVQVPPNRGAKYVFAHFKVCNTHIYTAEDWKEDIMDAHNAEIDAFALNIGPDSWQYDQVVAAYAAGKELLDSGRVKSAFGFFLSFDMALLPGQSAENAVPLRKYIRDFYNHPNQFKYDGKSFASTFSGQDSTFGHATPEEGWEAEFSRPLATAGMHVHFVPAFFISPERMVRYKAAQGSFFWNGGRTVTPQQVGSGHSVQPSGEPTSSEPLPDHGFIKAATLAKMTYVAAISPWLYIRSDKDLLEENLVHVSDGNLYPKRWEALVENRALVDIVEIVSWNDYDESSYIGRVKGTQSGSRPWVDGMDHSPWMKMTAYYAKAFKSGKWPEITQDEVYLVARTHPKNVNCPSDPTGSLKGHDELIDTLLAVVFARAPSDVILSISPSQKKAFHVEAGVHRLSVPFGSDGQYIRAEIARGGAPVLELQPEGFKFTDHPDRYNYNAFTAYIRKNIQGPMSQLSQDELQAHFGSLGCTSEPE